MTTRDMAGKGEARADEAASAERAVVTARHGAVLTITMNRPRVLNVFNETLADELLAAFASVAQDSGIRAVVLAGAGRSFMAGGDLSSFHADLAAAPATADLLIARFHALIRMIRDLPQPVIAAAQGPIAGGGVGLVLACDLVVAAEGTSFLSAYARLGTNPDDGTTWTLTRLLGSQRALAFILLNERMDAETAQSLGLVNRIVPEAELAQTALNMAERLGRSSLGATRAAKRLVNAARKTEFDQFLDAEKAAFIGNAGTADFREGITAFYDRREPGFR